MFKGLRFRLTVWFVCLSFAAYFITTLTTGVLFHYELTRAIDNELNELLLENVQNANYQNEQLVFTHRRSSLSMKPIRMLASIQLFDQSGMLVQATGAPGVNQLYDTVVEVPLYNHHLRSKSKPLYYNGKAVGHLQVQLPTDQREQAEKERMLMLMLTCPVLLLLLGAGGYFFTAMTTKPVEQAFSILREFMVDAGHELKTPLSVTQAVVDNLSRNHVDPDHLKRKLALISLSVSRMRSLVDDMTLLSRLESHKGIEPSVVMVPLHDILKETSEHMRPLFEEKKISLQMETLPCAWVRGNPDQLQRLIANLLSNALAYNNVEGSVSVGLKVSGRTAHLSICDTGIGIPPEALPKVFDRFFRAEQSRSRDTGGSGLGLSIVRAIIDAHRGTITITSRLNAGTQVAIALPLESEPSRLTHTIPTENA